MIRFERGALMGLNASIRKIVDAFRALADAVLEAARRIGEAFATLAATAVSIAWQIRHDRKFQTTPAQKRARRADNRRLKLLLRQSRRLRAQRHDALTTASLMANR